MLENGEGEYSIGMKKTHVLFALLLVIELCLPVITSLLVAPCPCHTLPPGVPCLVDCIPMGRGDTLAAILLKVRPYLIVLTAMAYAIFLWKQRKKTA
jgi:hypothetical protein